MSVQPSGSSTAIRGLQHVFTGYLASPVVADAAVVITDGSITWVGRDAECPSSEATLHADGMTLAPGLVDTHCHVHFSDYTPRQRSVDFLNGMLHGGVTQVISAGEVHLPRPQDRHGLHALALLAERIWHERAEHLPRVRAGVLLMDSSLSDGDFAYLASLGVGLAKVGFGTYPDLEACRAHIAKAQEAAMVVMAHSGPAGLPGATSLGSHELITLSPDVCAHVNGGPTSLPKEEIRELLDGASVLQVVAAGNVRTAAYTVEAAATESLLDRIVFGSETPSGAGVMPLAMLRLIATMSALTGVAPEVLWACGSGVARTVFGLAAGKIEVGAPADLCLLDSPVDSGHQSVSATLSAGDCPALVLAFIDGVAVINGSRNTPRPSNKLIATD